MRRHHLYLILSVISMVVAVGIGAAHKHCPFRGHDGLFAKHKRCNKHGHDVVQRDSGNDSAYEAAGRCMRARDFDGMAEYATILLDDSNPLDGQRLRAYALRGQGRYDEAAEAYTACMTSPVDRAVQCDAYIGRAECWHRLGKPDRAREDIAAAKELSRILVQKHGTEAAHYQMACALAVESGTLEGMSAARVRGQAIAHLKLAIEKGFDGWEHARADLDLDALRGHEDFEALFPAGE
jgi:hypothetical protein